MCGGKGSAISMVKASAECARKNGSSESCIVRNPNRELRIGEILFGGESIHRDGKRFAPCPCFLCRTISIADDSCGEDARFPAEAEPSVYCPYRAVVRDSSQPRPFRRSASDH